METTAGHGDARSRKAEQAILALLTERTFADAAKRVGVGKSTLERWMKEPEFRAELRAACRQVREVGIAQVTRTSLLAVETLERNLTCGKPEVEIRAASAILDRSQKYFEDMDLRDRLEAIEDRLGIDVPSIPSGTR